MRTERPEATATREPQRAVIDFIACDGHGICADLMPENFRLDEWGYPIVTDETVWPGEVRNAKRTMRLCPELALRLEAMKKEPPPLT